MPHTIAHRSTSLSGPIEPLEDRQMLSGSSSQPLRSPDDYLSEHLTAAEVQAILAQAASQALPTQIIVVTDREGVLLGSFRMRRVTGDTRGLRVRQRRILDKAIARARTAAFFESTQNAFTTRTARFIVQDHFPHPIQNTPGGPLYGVEFSTQPNSDIPLPSMTNLPGGGALNISGDPGGIPLFKNGIPVGGIGVAGDGRDVAVRKDLVDAVGTVDNKTRKFFNGQEEHDVDEQIALAGAKGFMAPARIQATQIFLDGLRLPFNFDKAAAAHPAQSFAQLLASGAGSILIPPIDSPVAPFPIISIAGITGELKNTNAAHRHFRFIDSDDPQAVKLTSDDVATIITDAVRESISIRGGIREPQGVPARVHITVVDRDGTLLGAFRMGDGTNFSFDVAVQKARTAAFFSDDTHAFSTTAIGFMAQAFFPPGIASTGPGPLFHIQNELSLNPANFKAPLHNGITIFPGGVPLYKNGQFVGAIGISGDGVTQDDLIAFTGAKRYEPAVKIRSDALGTSKVVSFIAGKIDDLAADFTLSRQQRLFSQSRIRARLDGIRLPYVKFPRNPEV
jgi:uncharacterized protein GlcG (DUF336 family)